MWKLEDRARALHEHDDDDHDPNENADDESAHAHSIHTLKARTHWHHTPARLRIHFSVTGREVFVSVDIEASAQSPGVGSLISIGACLVDRPEVGLYLELKPLPDRAWDASAEEIHGLARARLEDEGLEPAEAMARFEGWVLDVCSDGQPVFVGFNAPFDWMFVADYFWRYIGRNPFGVSALDLKSLYMGRAGVRAWEETRRVHVDERLRLHPDHTHQALEDARGQATIARLLLGDALDQSRDG